MSVNKNTIEFLIKELDYLSQHNFVPDGGVLASPRDLPQLEKYYCPCKYSSDIRMVLIDVLIKAPALLLTIDASLVPSACNAFKQYGYEVVTLVDQTDKVVVARYIKTTKGLICFWTSPRMDSYGLNGVLGKPTTFKQRLKFAWGVLRGTC
jgi:hypothetical protein